ncbi:hypothetical protein [Cyclobacterium plantarum]|uniref:Receptor L-domain domain-containing protein n=1 Tax=Cyclobacterium plantarum TaxID=2716263 RepID=A0ABX0H296_9BACT|nr:hypothetical protein [Cyclobacterium plantarum]NHE55749.1 hypothetical protein [Cyclobacterium plantarum]
MRTHLKNHRLIYLIYWIGLSFFLLNCEGLETPDPTTPSTPIEDPVIEDPQNDVVVPSIVLQLNRKSNSSAQHRMKELVLKHAVITIRTKEGNLTDYESKKISVEEKDGYYLTEKIHLPEGAYEVISFFVLNADHTVAEASPKKTSYLGENSTMALPLPFEISPVISEGEEEPVTRIPLQVVTIAGSKPEDFGFQSFEINVKSPLVFYVALVSNLRSMDFLPGFLQIVVLGETFDLELTSGITQSMELPIAETYTLKAISQDRENQNLTFSLEELMLFTEKPLFLEMKEEISECPDGDHLGNVILQNQSEVNEWKNSCRTGIVGDLTIRGNHPQDPIIDLSPLDGLISLSGALIIRDNLQLKTLKGLENLIQIGSMLQIENNPYLQGLNDLAGITASQLHVYVKDNHSLVNLEGLNGITDVTIFEISNNTTLKNFHGLEHLSWVNQLQIFFNENLESFDGLAGLRHIGELEINGQSKINSFEGFKNGVQNLNNLSLNNMSEIKNLRGLLAPGGKINKSLILFSTALETLEGLSLADEIPFNIEIQDNYSLQNLNQFSNLTAVGRRFNIENNRNLRSLSGLENLQSVGVGDGSDNAAKHPFNIRYNDFLGNFCDLKPLLEKGTYHQLVIADNFYNPTSPEILENECKQDF